jgi:hypothetical protein
MYARTAATAAFTPEAQFPAGIFAAQAVWRIVRRGPDMRDQRLRLDLWQQVDLFADVRHSREAFAMSAQVDARGLEPIDRNVIQVCREAFEVGIVEVAVEGEAETGDGVMKAKGVVAASHAQLPP